MRLMLECFKNAKLYYSDFLCSSFFYVYVAHLQPLTCLNISRTDNGLLDTQTFKWKLYRCEILVLFPNKELSSKS